MKSSPAPSRLASPKGAWPLCAALLVAAAAASAAGGEAALVVHGRGFSIEELRNGARAYANRAYVWKGVPEALAGWQFTRTSGGVPALLRVEARAETTLLVATVESQLDRVELKGWTRRRDLRFLYTTPHGSPMAVFERRLRAGETVEVPQGNWSGVLVIAPALQMGKHIRTPVPGTVIASSPDPQRVYIGCPGLAALPDGRYVASHSFFGPGTTYDRMAVYRSDDKGESWTKLADVAGQWWSTLFWHRGALYLMGVSRRYGDVVVRRSTDNGETWTEPKDADSGRLLADGGYHTAPVPVVVHRGRIWRTMEDNRAGGGWGPHFRAFVLSAPAEADLLKAANWRASNRLSFDQDWLEGERCGWLEGNVVVTPDGGLVNILRVEDPRGDRAAIVRISEDGRTVSFDPETGFIDFPGGRAKFTIRHDPQTGRYWSLVNKQRHPAAYRNLLCLTSSADLRAWKVESILLRHPDPKHHAFQYVHWLFDGKDILFVSRTAWDGSHNAHDANHLTFHRVPGFRERTPKTPPLE